MALLELTLAYTYAGQQCINRWNYIAAGTPASVFRTYGLIFAFGAIPAIGVYPVDTPLDAIAAMLHTSVTFQQLTAINVYDPSDFYQVPFVPALHGDIAGTPGSPILALGFRSSQVRRDISRATKRFAGVSEAVMEDNGTLGGPYIAPMDLIASKMDEVLEFDDEGNTLTFAPCVVKKQKYNTTTHLPDPNGTAYRYIPPGAGAEAAQIALTAVGIQWEKYSTVRSQVSRQVGHGN